MSEYLSSSPNSPAYRLLAGLAGATTLISLMSGCSSERNPVPPDSAVTEKGPSGSFSCMGPTKYIRFPQNSQEKSYLLLGLKTSTGEPYTSAKSAELKDLETDYTATLPVETTDTASRVYVKLPESVVQLSVTVYSGNDEYATCDTLLYPNRVRPIPTDTASVS